MARPLKLSKQLQGKICRAIRAGNYPAVAARAAGVSESTFYRWMQAGRAEDKGPFRAFYEAVKQAEAESEVYNVALLSKAAKREWRAAQALLERRHAERWRRRERYEHTIEDERPQIDLTKLSDRDLKALERIHARVAKPE